MVDFQGNCCGFLALGESVYHYSKHQI